MANNRDYLNKRKITFWKSDSALTSPRVSIILSSSKDSGKIAKAVRALRHEGKASFKLSQETANKIVEVAEKPQNA